MAATLNRTLRARPLGGDLPGGFAYEHCDIPEAMTIANYKRARAHGHAGRYRPRPRRRDQRTTN